MSAGSPSVSCDWLFVDGSSLIFRAFYGVPKTVRSPDGKLINAGRGFLETLTRLIGTRAAAPHRRRQRCRLAAGLARRAHPGIQGAARRGADPARAHPADAGHRRVPPRHRHRRTRRRGLRGGGRDRDLDREGAWERSRSSAATAICSRWSRIRASPCSTRRRAGWRIVDEAEVTRRYGIPGRRYADFAMLRGDPSDGLPGLKGVGAVAAASMIREHGGIAALLDGDSGSAQTNQDYLTRAMQVVPPVADLPIELPRGKRTHYPDDPESLNALMAEHGLQAACEPPRRRAERAGARGLTMTRIRTDRATARRDRHRGAAPPLLTLDPRPAAGDASRAHMSSCTSGSSSHWAC